MFLYNVHTPTKTFALTQKENESHGKLVDRIIQKSGINKEESQGVKGKKDGAGLVYEYEGGRWSLDDDDDLEILLSRFPPSSTPSVTLHLTLPSHHAHFATPPAYASALKNPKSPTSTSGSKKAKSPSINGTAPSTSTKSAKSDSDSKPKATEAAPFGVKSNGPPSLGAVAAPTSGKAQIGGQAPTVTAKDFGGVTTINTSGPASKSDRNVSTSSSKRVGGSGRGSDVKSFVSTVSRKSKYGDGTTEASGDKHKRAWNDFHNDSGVRTVMGQIGETKNVRMLLKPGYRHVYVSRKFAIKNKLVPATFAMGLSGYSGLKPIPPVSITIGSKRASHPAMINEEQHFDVVLGRSWVEKMGVKVDPHNQTSLTYMDSGEMIPCDIVVMKDAEGNKIFIT